jgi:phosphatidylglycerophosphate synthase
MSTLDTQINPENSEGGAARNSELRAAFAKHFDNAAKYIGAEFPGVTPNHITLAGFLGVAAVGTTAVLVSKNMFKPAMVGLGILHGLSSGSDGIDGALARIKGGSPQGPLIDTFFDRAAELLTTGIHATMAYMQDRPTEGDIALAAMATTTLPSLFRALAEARGVIVGENGSDGTILDRAIGVAGTRGGRATGGAIGIGLGFVPGVIGVSDGISAGSNIVVASQRLHGTLFEDSTHRKQGVEPTEKETKDASLRAKVLAGVAISGAYGAYSIRKALKSL